MRRQKPAGKLAALGMVAWVRAIARPFSDVKCRELVDDFLLAECLASVLATRYVTYGGQPFLARGAMCEWELLSR